MSYEPQPIEPSDVELAQEHLELAERIAANVHELWADQRMRDGWRHGPRRDEERREHPSLVAYEDLPESEKVYDRRIALGTIAAILAHGYDIVRR